MSRCVHMACLKVIYIIYMIVPEKRGRKVTIKWGINIWTTNKSTQLQLYKKIQRS